jgi:hypothetical protein
MRYGHSSVTCRLGLSGALDAISNPVLSPSPSVTNIELNSDLLALLQNMSVVSAGKIFLVSTHQTDTIYTI